MAPAAGGPPAGSPPAGGPPPGGPPLGGPPVGGPPAGGGIGAGKFLLITMFIRDAMDHDVPNGGGTVGDKVDIEGVFSGVGACHQHARVDGLASAGPR
jgi:hypothetical protein